MSKSYQTVVNDSTKKVKTKLFLTTTSLVILAFSSMFYSRILDTLGAPSVVNFLHFIIIPSVCTFTLYNSRSLKRRQVEILNKLLVGLSLFLGIVILSAFWNHAGAINIPLAYLLLVEPFVLLVGFTSLPISLGNFRIQQKWLVIAGIINCSLALIQRYILQFQLREGQGDNIQGAFYDSGGGHVESALVSMTFGLYYFFSMTRANIWLRGAVLSAMCLQCIVADAKQVILILLVAAGIEFFLLVKNPINALKYAALFIAICSIFIWAIYNIEALDAFTTWARPDIYGPQGEATLLKTASFRIISSYHTSPVNQLLGLGPGHTVGRLGGWMINKYWYILGPLGATFHPASGDVWSAVAESWLGDQSSLFSPLFSWAGIWGDLGWLGIGSYLYLWFVVWRYFCSDNLSKFFVLAVLISGTIFTQLEAPGYTLFIMYVIYLRWSKGCFVNAWLLNRSKHISESHITTF